MAQRRKLCFLAWTLSGQRHQRRETAVARSKNRAGHLFRMAAFSLHHSLTPLGNYLRRMKAKLGPKAATGGDRPQDRSDLLHHGQKTSRI